MEMTVTIEPTNCEHCKKKTLQCISAGKKANGSKWIVTVCQECLIASGNGLNSHLLSRLTNTETATTFIPQFQPIGA
jgi:hypothetical protein